MSSSESEDSREKASPRHALHLIDERKMLDTVRLICLRRRERTFPHQTQLTCRWDKPDFTTVR